MNSVFSGHLRVFFLLILPLVVLMPSRSTGGSISGVFFFETVFYVAQADFELAV